MPAWSVIAHSNTVASATLDITGLTLSTYRAIRGIISDLTVVSDNTSPVLQFYLNGSLVTSNYRYIINIRTGGSSGEHHGTGEAVMWLSDWNNKMSNNANAAFMSDFQLSDPAGSGINRHVTFKSVYSNQGTNILSTNRGILAVGNNDPITGFRLKTFDGSGLATARLTLLGLV